VKFDTCWPCRLTERQNVRAQQEYKKQNYRIFIEPTRRPIIENPTTEEFIAIVAEACDADSRKITNKKLCSKTTLWARQVIVYLAREDLKIPFSQIVLDFKTKDNVAKYAYRVVADYVQQNQEVAEAINQISARYVLTNKEAAVSP